ncbi:MULTISPECIES: VRR-NUC domain-containing protein [unclassified Thioalkalivibrio]|uniref:VRR-NUC domain-containing protein n=1 Tax=unclassified Thioalkalivibrio TaxID=2621013 RepID=UPI000368F776|nr:MULTISPECIES: VRR-NUC domain-containing protein [unclassified Thioalkalivibrio]
MATSPDFRFTFHRERREKFRAGELSEEWVQRYPGLFDSDDVRILQTAHQRQYHFFEWLSAVLLFEATGYKSLMEKYCAKSHPRKITLFEEMVPGDVFGYLMGARSGHPDLFSYHPETGDWFFSEVKGAKDQLRDEQISMHEELKAMTGRRVRIIQLDEIDV